MSTNDHRRFLAWPEKALLVEAVLLGGLFALFFAAVYGTTDSITRLRGTRVPVDFGFEQRIPFVAPMLVFYLSIYPLFWLAPFVLRTRRECRALVGSMAVMTGLAGIAFLLLPGETAFPPPPVPAFWSPLYTFADACNLDHNLLPSLHVALSIFCVDVFARRGGKAAGLLLWAWGVAIASSTVLTHQHHLLDVVTGFLLAIAVSRLIYPRWAKRAVAEVAGSAESASSG